ncbi:MAG: Phosphomannomutase [Candidatus Giovannonibacteria bacterium GW2011_GWB1_47_6b]|uniref:Phosphomannomutase n=1 Tax=Candidatus Giovannonibacteria bacterium GW2011_GWB1_47_6b TaxID=1618655 RepID=A0A0G1W1S3_9BACT|nr:MAG: Phosphomannomutase [Candidatus Giovannonibacteria bacterium GW2011_GWB1_47_6b]
MDSSIFKAYDIRGKYPQEINEKIVSEIIRRFFNSKFKIIIGHDARLSSPSLYKALNKNLKIDNSCLPVGMGKLKIVPAGMTTTPMLYFLVNKLKADFGIMLTASHNPKEYNGLKIVGKNAIPISGKEILRIMNKE